MTESTISELIERGLHAQYGRDPERLQGARQAVRDELLAMGWTLPPYTDAAYDFRHTVIHRVTDWAVLERIVTARKSAALRLNSRTVAMLYAEAGKDDWAAMSDAEHAFATAAINAQLD